MVIYKSLGLAAVGAGRLKAKERDSRVKKEIQILHNKTN